MTPCRVRENSSLAKPEKWGKGIRDTVSKPSRRNLLEHDLPRWLGSCRGKRRIILALLRLPEFIQARIQRDVNALKRSPPLKPTRSQRRKLMSERIYEIV